MLPARHALIVLAVPMALGAVFSPGAVAANVLPSLGAGTPDLVVEQIYSQTHVPADGALVRNLIYVHVGNWGNGDAGPSRLFWKMRDVAGHASDVAGAQANGHTATGWIDVRALRAGGDSANYTIDVPDYSNANPWPGSVSRYHLLAVADAMDAVAEFNDENNHLEADVYGGEAGRTR